MKSFASAVLSLMTSSPLYAQDAVYGNWLLNQTRDNVSNESSYMIINTNHLDPAGIEAPLVAVTCKGIGLFQLGYLGVSEIEYRFEHQPKSQTAQTVFKESDSFVWDLFNEDGFWQEKRWKEPLMPFLEENMLYVRFSPPGARTVNMSFDNEGFGQAFEALDKGCTAG